MTTKELLSESVEAAKLRECKEFALVAGDAVDRVVLFGAGNLGRKIARSLKQGGTTPLAFADNNSKLVGTKVEGIPVFSLEQCCTRWRSDAVFVVTIFRPTFDGGMQARLEELRKLGCERVTTFLPLAWNLQGVLPHYGADLPSIILAQAADLHALAASLTDEISKETFRQQLQWRLRGDFSEVSPPVSDQYFPKDLISPNDEEVFVDGGAFDGDTLRAMPWSWKRAWAVEPDPKNFMKLESCSLPNVKKRNVALGRAPGRVCFEALGTMASTVAASGSIEVEVATLDDLLCEETPSFLKLDVEGEELAALEGGLQILQRNAPVVAVCIYHRASDLWTIPKCLMKVLTQHYYSMRAHASDGFELVLYVYSIHRASLK